MCHAMYIVHQDATKDQRPNAVCITSEIVCYAALVDTNQPSCNKIHAPQQLDGKLVLSTVS